METIIRAWEDFLLDLPKIIETSRQIETAYTNAATKGSTSTGAPTDEVECHYLCFTKATSSQLWLLDGDRDGLLAYSESCGMDVDVLESPNREIIQTFLDEHGKATSDNFATMASVQAWLEFVLTPEAVVEEHPIP